MVQKVKLYGCRHSGTKYLTCLLELNWEVKVVLKKYGHKHELPENLPSQIPVIFIHKHPAAYIASARDRKWGFGSRPPDFFVNRWVEHNQAWFEVANIHVPYEELLFNFSDMMKEIEEKLKVEPKDKKYFNVTKYCGNPNRVVKYKYYKDKEYMTLMGQEDLKALETIPKDLMKKLGYID